MTAVFAHRGCTEGLRREHARGLRRGRAGLGADGVELDVRLTADGALVVHHDAEIPGVGRRSPSSGWPTCPPTSRSWPTPWRLRGHGGERRDQERARSDPGWDPGEARGGADGGGDRRGRAGRDRVDRLVLPAGHAAGGAGGRRGAWRSAGCWGFGDRRPGRRWPRRPTAGLPGRPPLRPRGRRRPGGAGPRRRAWPSTSGRSTRPTTCEPWSSSGVDTVITDRLSEALAVAGVERRLRVGPAAVGRAQRWATPRKACHRAEWRDQARFHKDGRP